MSTYFDTNLQKKKKKCLVHVMFTGCAKHYHPYLELT